MLTAFKDSKKAPFLPEEDIAISSGWKNNCGFNSIIHLWMALPDDMFVYLYDKFPVVKLIHQVFCNEYGGGEATIEKLLAFRQLEVLNNPWDREIIWGDIFRKVLQALAQAEIQRINELPLDHEADVDEVQYNFDETDLAYLAEWRCVDFRMLKLLTQRMGLKLTVYNQIEALSEFESPIYEFEPLEEACWQAELFFNGGHYDFSFPDKSVNAKHNAARKDSFLLKNIPSLFTDQKSVQKSKIDVELMGQIQGAAKQVITAVNKKLAEAKNTLKM